MAFSSDVSVDQTRDALAATQAKLDNLNESRTKWQTLISAKNLIENNQAEAEKFARYKKAAQKVVSKLLADRVDSFCDKVSAYLPEGWEFGVMVTDNGVAISTTPEEGRVGPSVLRHHGNRGIAR